MLSELRIENFAIIDQLELHFGAGLITFTGETGAGKSIIIDAVELILGGRADSTVVRAGAERATLEATFTIPFEERQAVHEILEREEMLDDPDYVVLAREVRLEGRNIARVNGRTVNVTMLRELGEHLVDVHGQSEHLSLLRVSHHLDLLDRYAVTAEPEVPLLEDLLENYRRSFRMLQAVQHELARLRQAERDAARRAEMLSFQIEEIEAARLKPDEEETLREERNRLANAEGLALLSQEAIQALDEGAPDAPSANELFGQVVDALSGLARMDPSQQELHEQAQSMLETMDDLAMRLRDYLENIEFNPRRLDQVEERLALIHGLKRKYGDTIPAILAFAEQARMDLDEITHAEERMEELQAQELAMRQQLGQQGFALSKKRRAAAERLSSAVENELNDLYMSGAHFQVQFEQRPDPNGVPLPEGPVVAFDANGLERVEFLIAPNPGEGFKPLAKIASGGETSRLMLALKNVLAKADHIPTLIFDEIDQGIGGRVGSIVGMKLWSLARDHQVLCITHLPQLAAFGEQHFQVQKRIGAGRTATGVSSLEGQERVQELALMMGELSESTLRSAEELLETVNHRTTGGSGKTQPSLL